MKSIKSLVAVIILLSCISLSHAVVKPEIYKVSGTGFVFYTLDNQGKIQLYQVENAKIKLVDQFVPKFPEKDVIISSTAPDGREYKSPKYKWMGYAGNLHYFQVTKTPAILEYDRTSHTFKKRFSPYPKILERVYKLKDSLVLCAGMVIPDRTKQPCRDKYFVKKALDWTDNRACFGVGRNLITSMDFPDTFLFSDCKLAAIYFPKAGEMAYYDTNSGDLVKKFQIARNHNVLKNDKVGKKEFLYESKGIPCLLKLSEQEALIFKLKDNQWQLAQQVPGSFQGGIVLDTHVVLVTTGGKIEEKALDF